MFAAYIIVTILAAAANLYAASNDFRRVEWILAAMTRLGEPPVPQALELLGSYGFGH
jgi:hypothetical protein